MGFSLVFLNKHFSKEYARKTYKPETKATGQIF